MKKQLATVLAATAVFGATTAFAANPFSDVTPNDWAYQAVEQLAADGIINGYPNGTFQGQKDITRFEVAQMTAKAMAYQGRINAEQQALINRLANEYSSELNNLGVRVSNLEDRVGNVKVTGDARMRVQSFTKSSNRQFDGNTALPFGDGNGSVTSNGKANMFDFRGRIQFNANVNKNTEAVIRLSSGNREFGDTSSDNDGDSNKNAHIDRVYVTHNFGKNVNATVGRFTETIGAGLIHDGAFDGAKANIGNDRVNFSAAYGYLTSGATHNTWDGMNFKKGTYTITDTNGNEHEVELDKDYTYNHAKNWENTSEADNMSMTVLQLDGKLGNHGNLGGFYGKINKNGKAMGNYLVNDGTTNFSEFEGYKSGDGLNHAELKDLYGFNTKWNFNRWFVGGEWTKSNLADSQAWVAGAGYGNYDISKQGTYNLMMQYFKQDKNAFIADTTWDQPYGANYKGWVATAQYALMKNVGLKAVYAFDSKYADKDVALAGTNENTNRSDYFLGEVNVLF